LNTKLNTVTDEQLIHWVKNRVVGRDDILASGYQGHVYFYNENGQRLVIKVASGRGPLRWLRSRMLRHEFNVYRRIAELRGCPRCYGLIGGRYLVLEYLDGVSLRYTEVADRAKYFHELFGIITELHRRGIAHFDLKRKANLMVLPGSMPGVVDFGSAIIRRPGFAPFNHFLYDLAAQFDFNAWIKLKYKKRLCDVSDADRVHYRRTRTEKVARQFKRVYKLLKLLRRIGSSRRATRLSSDSASDVVEFRDRDPAVRDRRRGADDGGKTVRVSRR